MLPLLMELLEDAAISARFGASSAPEVLLVKMWYFVD